MAQGSPLVGPSMTPDGQVPGVCYRRDWYLGDAQNLVSGAPFTQTLSNNTGAAGNLGGRPCYIITNGNTGITDSTNFAVAVASIIPQAGKIIRVRGSYYASSVSNDIALGIGVVGTGMIASDPTNHIMIRKLVAETTFSVRARKASGTAQTFAVGPTIAASTWYDIEIWIRQNTGAAAGTGSVQVYIATSGGVPQDSGVFNFANNFPDTVAMAPFFSYRAGLTDALTSGIGYLGIEQEL